MSNTPQTPSFESLSEVSRIESDYFCEQCGYNLHGQIVRRDPPTQVLLARCPECGRFHPAIGASSAARLWVDRLARAGLVLWLIIAYSAIVAVVFVHFGLMELVLRELRHYDLYPTAPRRGMTIMLAIGAGGSLLLGLIASAASAIAFPHWKRWSFLIAAVLWPTISAVLILSWISQGRRAIQFPDASNLYVAGFAGLFVVAAATGALVGRPLARLAVRIILPPRVHPMFAYLWTADGKPPPRGQVWPITRQS